MAARKIDGAWYTDFRIRKVRYRKRSPQNTRAGAQAYENYLRGEIAKMGSLEHLYAQEPSKEKPEPTFGEFAEQWMKDYVEVKNKWSERVSKRCKLNRYLLPEFGKSKLSEITALAIDRHIAKQRQDGLSAKSINNQLTILRKCLVTAVKWEALKEVPAIEFLDVVPPDIEARTPEEIEKLLAVCDPLPWRVFILTKLKTGLRFSEMKALEWQDVNLDAAMLVVRRGDVRGHVSTPKSRKSKRTIPLTSDVVEALRSLPRVSERVFTCHGRSITYENAWYHLDRACKRAGIRHMGWHALRHTFATDLIARNAPDKAVQDLMGHEKIEMTHRYTHLPQAVLRQAINLLEPNTSPAWAAGGQSAHSAPRLESKSLKVEVTFFPQPSENTACGAVLSTW